MASSDKRSPNVRAYLTRRQDLETGLVGVSAIQLIHGSGDIVLVSSTGADPGTGEVTLGLAATGVVPGQYNTFIVDANGRITKAWTTQYKATGGGNSSGSVANQSTYAQSASFWISGTGQIDGGLSVGSLVSGPIDATRITLGEPLGIASGGTGASVVAAHAVLAGPSAGTTPAAPAWRQLDAADLPDYPWTRLVATPTTVAGYGIIDVYTRAQSDARYLAIPLGTVNQYLRGDKNWAEVNTDTVNEGAKLFFTDARARAAISALGSNISYVPASGVISFTPTPVFDSVTINNTPTQANQAATKDYVDTAVASSVPNISVDRFVVILGSEHVYSLTSIPATGSIQVYLNGLALFEGVLDDYTVSSNTITINAAVVLTTGDVLHVRYHN